MKTIEIFFYIVTIFWFINEVRNTKNLCAKKGDTKVKDNVNIYIIWIIFILGLSLPIIIISKITDFFIAKGQWIQYLGLFLYISGIVLRIAVINYLGKYFTLDLTIKQDHKLITDGYYKLVRHPVYTAVLMTFLGFGLFLNNWISLAFAFLPVFAALIVRMKTEEAALVEKFGDEYIEYRKSTKKLIPFIY
jgi:protein-S-isoprenylcysteine O-methyltransferase Ste14